MLNSPPPVSECTIPSPRATISRQSWNFRLLLGLIVLSGAVIRIVFHVDRAWEGDEWGSIGALGLPYAKLLSCFGAAWTMNFYLAALKAIDSLAPGHRQWVLVLPGLICGCWLIVLAAAIALRLGSPRAALLAALLVAINPYLASYSITIRSYILLAAFSSAMLMYLLDWMLQRRLRDAVAFAACAALALLSHLNAVYALGAMAVIALAWTWNRHDDPRQAMRDLLQLAIPALVLVGLAAAAYIPQLPDIAAFRRKWSDTPPTSLSFLPMMATAFFGDEWAVVPVLVGICYSTWRAIHQRCLSQYLLPAIIVPVALICLAGVSHFPHAYARFLIFIAPWLFILIADGLSAARTRAGLASGGLVAAAILFSQAVSLGDVYKDAHATPWHHAAAYIKEHRDTNDRCALVGRGILASGMHLFGVPTAQHARDAITKLPPNAPARLFVVDADGLVPTRRTVASFGKLQILSLSGTPRQIAEQLLRDLDEATNNQEDARLMHAYNNMAQLAQWLGQPQRAIAYERLYLKSRLRDYRTRFTPPQLPFED